jgi:hypothetical protein
MPDTLVLPQIFQKCSSILVVLEYLSKSEGFSNISA